MTDDIGDGPPGRYPLGPGRIAGMTLTARLATIGASFGVVYAILASVAF